MTRGARAATVGLLVTVVACSTSSCSVVGAVSRASERPAGASTQGAAPGGGGTSSPAPSSVPPPPTTVDLTAPPSAAPTSATPVPPAAGAAGAGEVTMYVEGVPQGAVIDHAGSFMVHARLATRRARQYELDNRYFDKGRQVGRVAATVDRRGAGSPAATITATNASTRKAAVYTTTADGAVTIKAQGRARVTKKLSELKKSTRDDIGFITHVEELIPSTGVPGITYQGRQHVAGGDLFRFGFTQRLDVGRGPENLAAVITVDDRMRMRALDVRQGGRPYLSVRVGAYPAATDGTA